MMEYKEHLRNLKICQEKEILILAEFELDFLIGFFMPNGELEKTEVYKSIKNNLKVNGYQIEKQNYRSFISKKIRTYKIKYNFIFNFKGFFLENTE